MAVNNEYLKFPEVNDYVKDLSPLEERMVAPIIPFAQIKPLLPYALNPQLSLKNSIVNINVDVNDIIKVLPRKFDEWSTVQIQFKSNIK